MQLIKLIPLALPVNLPAAEPVPSYLEVYPGPSQRVGLSDPASRVILHPDTFSFAHFNTIVFGEPGDVCVLLKTADLLHAGIFWDQKDIERLSALVLDDAEAQMRLPIQEGNGPTMIIDNDKVVAATGGPYGICWSGNRQLGYHRVTFKFDEYAYSWWYKIEP
jgi:hypothetical protein